MKPEEKILVSQIKTRNRKVFEMLFMKYYPQLVTFAEGMLFDVDASKDVVQNLFIHIWENAEDIEIKSSIQGYLFQATRNRCLNRIKRVKIRDGKNILYLEGMLNSMRSVTEIDDCLTALIMETINSLPSRMCMIFKMKYLENQKQREIADALGITENTVKSQLSRAKKKLRKSGLLNHLLEFSN